MALTETERDDLKARAKALRDQVNQLVDFCDDGSPHQVNLAAIRSAQLALELAILAVHETTD